MNCRQIKKAALERAKARYPNSQRKAHYEFIRLWEAECKKYTASLLAQRNGGNTEIAQIQ